MTPAEKRIKELIDRWLTSIELHLQYVDLSEEAYAEIQAWPKHDRPTRWVLELAKQKANELKESFDARHQMGDSKFADALELMSFLANLVGAQHVDRFVPLAEPQAETAIPRPTPRAVAPTPATSDVPKWYSQAHATQSPQSKLPPAKPQSAAPTLQAPPVVTAAPSKPLRSPDPEPTREMPRDLSRESSKLRPQMQPAASVQQAGHKLDAKKAGQTKSAAPAAASKQAEKTPATIDETHAKVIADAVRLISWGRTWHELAELIARMADRPPIAEVRKILRIHRASIEKSAKDAAK